MTKSTLLTLEAVAEQFANWRSTKKPKEKIPEHLWGMIRNLLTNYKPTKIMTRLQISTKQMRDKGLLPTLKSKPKENASNTFVNLDITRSALSSLTAPTNLILERSDGTKLTIISPTQILMDKLLNLFLG
jgi:hypothetical protein